MNDTSKGPERDRREPGRPGRSPRSGSSGGGAAARGAGGRRPDVPGERRGAPAEGRRPERGRGGAGGGAGRDAGRTHAPRAGAGRARDDRAQQSRPAPRHPVGPAIADDVAFSDLDRAARGRLRTLSKDTAEVVGKHLVMAGRLVDEDPELAYEHAQAAVRRAGRVDVVREAAGITAYRTGRYAEALRELRTVRRLNGSSEHLPIMADCERGLGRPERALALAAAPEAASLDAVGRTELAIVVSGARSDLGETDAALAVLDQVPPAGRQGELAVRVTEARAAALEAAGRADEAARLLATLGSAASGPVPEDVVVYDLAEEPADGSTDVPGEDVR